MGRKVLDLGMMVDLIFLNSEMSLQQALDDVSQGGSAFAIVITPQHQVHHSCTVNIMFGTPQGMWVILWTAGSVSLREPDGAVDWSMSSYEQWGSGWELLSQADPGQKGAQEQITSGRWRVASVNVCLIV